MKRSEIKENRLKWAKFLMEKGRKKAEGLLDKGNGERCCLGHGCYILGIKREHDKISNVYYYGRQSEDAHAPDEFIQAVGLWDHAGITNGTPNKGHSFVSMNDNEGMSPYEIGQYILDNIEGGSGTNFRPLSDWKD